MTVTNLAIQGNEQSGALMRDASCLSDVVTPSVSRSDASIGGSPDAASARREALWDAAAIFMLSHGVLISVAILGPADAVAVLVGCVLGGVYAAGVLIVLHDAMHRRFSGRFATVNSLPVHLAMPIGGWVERRASRHVPVHHRFVGVYPDDDFTVASKFLRLHHAAPRRWWHRFQHWYAWVAYALAWPIDQVSQLRDLVRGDRDPSIDPGGVSVGHRWASFITERTIDLAVVVPYLWYIESRTLLLMLVPALLVAGFASTVTLAIGHVNEGLLLTAEHSGTAADVGDVIAATASFRVRLPVLRWLTGGLGDHLAHHLVPDAPRRDLPALNQRCVQLGRDELEVVAVVYPSVRSAVAAHWRELRSLGSSPR